MLHFWCDRNSGVRLCYSAEPGRGALDLDQAARGRLFAECRDHGLSQRQRHIPTGPGGDQVETLNRINELLAGRSIGDFLFGFGALFAIINPYGLAFVFLERTIGLSEPERARIAFRVAAYAFFVLLGSLFVGSEIMRFFGISMPALRIAGGLVVASTAWSMLHATPVAASDRASSSGSYAAVREMAFFPLTIPLTTGPGTIASAVAISTNRPGDLDALFSLSIVWLVIAVAVSATIYHAYRKSGAMARLFGQEGTSVITRLSAFLLLCIGVQIMITGAVEVGQSIHAGVSRP